MLEKTMLIKMNQQAYGTTRFQILTGDQIERIYFAALDVLEISGARIFHEEALELFTNSDAVVSETHRVRIPTAMVEQALGSCPSKSNLTGRNGNRSIKLQKNEVAFGSGADGYCLKNDSHTELLAAIKNLLAGKSYISPSVSGKVLEGYLEGRQKRAA